MSQPSLFAVPLDPQTLMEGKTVCPCCGRLARAYCKTLDRRLLYLLDEIVRHLDRKRRPFNPQQVWNNNHLKITDSNKLHYWEIIESVKKRNGWWKVTQLGWDFYDDKVELDRRLWVFNDKVVFRDGEKVTASKLDPRWQTCRLDYALDYAPVPNEALPQATVIAS